MTTHTDVTTAAAAALASGYMTGNDEYQPTHYIDRDEIKAVVMTCGPDPAPAEVADARAIAAALHPTIDALDAARAEVERLRIGLGGAAHGNADRMRKSLLAERDAIAEKIAVAIEAACPGCEMAVECDYQIAARIAREVGKA